MRQEVDGGGSDGLKTTEEEPDGQLLPAASVSFCARMKIREETEGAKEPERKGTESQCRKGVEKTEKKEHPYDTLGVKTTGRGKKSKR